MFDTIVSCLRFFWSNHSYICIRQILWINTHIQTQIYLMDKKPIHTWIIFEYLLSLDLIIIYIYSSLLPIIWAILDRLKKNFTMEVKTGLAGRTENRTPVRSETSWESACARTGQNRENRLKTSWTSRMIFFYFFRKNQNFIFF